MQFDPVVEGRKNTYFKMIECIVPRPIAWVSTRSEAGVENIAPFSFFTGVTSSPPTLLFCCGTQRGGAPKDTAANILETGEFVVNIVPHDLAGAMVQTSASYPADVDEFDAARIEKLPSQRVRPSRVKGVPISIECTRHAVQLIEDDRGRVTSYVIVGRMVLIHIADEILDADGRVDMNRLDVVSRLGGQDYARIDTPFEIPRPRLT